MIAGLYRRILMMIGRGRTTVVDDSKSVQFVQLDSLLPGEVRDSTPRLAEYGFTSYPPAGTDAVAVFLAGNRSSGIIIATGNQTYRVTGLASGDACIYDSRGQTVTLTASGIVVNGNGLNLTVNDTPTVTINSATEVIMNTALLQVNGAIKATGNITDTSGTNTDTVAGMRTIFNAHVHGGVTRGAAATDGTSTPM